MKTRIPKHSVFIGCGGIASYLAPLIVRLQVARYKNETRVTLIDGDKLTRRNLERQQFAETIWRDQPHIYKAQALAVELHSMFPNIVITDICEFLGQHNQTKIKEHLAATTDLFMFCCADNHAARRFSIATAETAPAPIIIAANETESSEAYYWRPGKRAAYIPDPRQYYPDIQTSVDGDPLNVAHCNDLDTLSTTPQTAIANFNAAAHAASLAWHVWQAPEVCTYHLFGGLLGRQGKYALPPKN